MLGHRIGWKPTLNHMRGKYRSILSKDENENSLTRLELALAAKYAVQSGHCRPALLVRSHSLSKAVYESENIPSGTVVEMLSEEVRTYRQYITENLDADIYHYDDFETFETLAREALIQQLSTGASSDTYKDNRFPELDRNKDIRLLNKLTRKHCTLLFGQSGSGKTWLAQKWLSDSAEEKKLMFDVKANSIHDINRLFSPSEQTERYTATDPYGTIAAFSNTSLPYSLCIDACRTPGG